MEDPAEDDQDPVSAAIRRARARMGGTLAGTRAEAHESNDDVRRTVSSALELFAGPRITAAGSALEDYTAEIVAVGALSRAASGEAPMSEEEVRGVWDFLRIIFNGLYEK
ncbi:MAG: hypothetical protein Q4P23_09015 [Micrococcaceae bacterium]|nr:hypothetical protein [Micrococcaceae bacterium]